LVVTNLIKNCTIVPLGKKLQPTSVGFNFKKSFSVQGQ
jgi:hypothetical protein